MAILLLFAFLSGLVTILAPCIWPLLPIILSSSVSGGHKKSLGITMGIMLSFAIFTLSISYLVSFFNFDPNFLRLFAVVIIGFLGITLVVPALSAKLEGLVSRLSSRFSGSSAQKSGFFGGFLTGFSLGIIWAPCAGPILATIATLAATQTVSFQLILVTLAYILGVGIPLFIFSYGGNILFTRSRALSKYTGRIQQVFGVVMILTAIAIYTNYDKVIQVKLLDLFPSYSSFLTSFEKSTVVQDQLNKLKNVKDSAEQNLLDQSLLFNQNYAAPEFVGITKWLNVPAGQSSLTLKDLKGKVVLVDFWTYTCINCIRTLPYVTSWYNKYKDDGFVVVGVHTPEFEFEKNTTNVENAIKQYTILYPVAQDNNYATWQAYNNQYWPAEYLIDAKGVVRRTHFGEGEYDQMEEAIQKLLKEKGASVSSTLVPLSDQTPHIALSPETYLGSARMERFASNEPIVGGVQTFTHPGQLSANEWAYSGKWNVGEEFAQSVKDSTIDFNFNADKVFLVVTPSKKGEQAKIFLDGKDISSGQSGKDVVKGVVTFDVPRLYNLVDLKGKPGNHLLRIQFLNSDTKVYAFTFG